jgi:hypothetical protein
MLAKELNNGRPDSCSATPALLLTAIKRMQFGLSFRIGERAFRNVSALAKENLSNLR